MWVSSIFIKAQMDVVKFLVNSGNVLSYFSQ